MGTSGAREDGLRQPGPVMVSHLFPEERAALLELLGQLSPEEWARPTVCPGWSVKDIGLHLLGDDMGKLSASRDGFRHSPPASARSTGDAWADLVAWLNLWNEGWVQAMRRLSPRLLCQMLEFTGKQIYQHFSSLDPLVTGGPVSWAGPGPAPVWLDVAREYTERWTHQQQIRDALARPGLKGPRYLAPVLATFVRALPHTFRYVAAGDGASVLLTISGESGSEWTLRREAGRWALYQGALAACDAHVTLEQESTWRLFTRGISKEEALRHATLAGDPLLCLKVLDTVAIIA